LSKMSIRVREQCAPTFFFYLYRSGNARARVSTNWTSQAVLLVAARGFALALFFARWSRLTLATRRHTPHSMANNSVAQLAAYIASRRTHFAKMMSSDIARLRVEFGNRLVNEALELSQHTLRTALSIGGEQQQRRARHARPDRAGCGAASGRCKRCTLGSMRKPDHAGAARSAGSWSWGHPIAVPQAPRPLSIFWPKIFVFHHQ
jgi:hypothetical protein